jgi:hypothetical protein
VRGTGELYEGSLMGWLSNPATVKTILTLRSVLAHGKRSDLGQ